MEQIGAIKTVHIGQVVQAPERYYTNQTKRSEKCPRKTKIRLMQMRIELRGDSMRTRSSGTSEKLGREEMIAAMKR
jgi:hypothetical protein